MDIVMEVIVIFIVVYGGSFLLTLRKRGIILYFPNKKTKGTITKVTTRHRTSWEPRREGNLGGRRLYIAEKFAEVEFYDGTRMVVAESLFPVLDDAKVGDEVIVRYREGRERPVYVGETRQRNYAR